MPQRDDDQAVTDLEQLKAESHEELDRLHEEARGQTTEEAIAASDAHHERQKLGIVQDVEKFAALGAESPHYKPLTASRVSRVLFDLPEEQAQAQLVVRIGKDVPGIAMDYIAMDGDLEVDDQGRLVLSVPESVAEFFRQQGRRRNAREIQRALGL